jgi:hypothetical protein
MCEVNPLAIATKAMQLDITPVPYTRMSPGHHCRSCWIGCQMDLNAGGFAVPVSALNCFDTLSILLLVPVFDGVIYPYCKRQGYQLSMLTKIGAL